MQHRVIIKQQDQKDCGICCLESIIKYYNGYVPLEKIREDTLTSIRGTSAFHMVETLKNYGFDAYGSKVKKEKLFTTEIPLPAIVHVVLDNGLNHYMVLYEIRKDKVIVMDPAIGKRVINDTDFFWIWSEVLIIAYPKEKIRIETKEKNNFVISLNFLGSHKQELMLLIASNIFLLFLNIINSFYVKIALTYLHRKSELICIIISFGIIAILNICFTIDLLKRIKRTNRRLSFFHASSFLNHLFSLPLIKLKSRNIGDFVTRFWETLELKFIYTDLYENFILSGLTLIGSFCFLFLIHETIFHYYVLLSLIYLIFQVIAQSQSYKTEKVMIQEKAIFQNKILEKISVFEVYHYLHQTKQLQTNIEKDLISYLLQEEQKNKFYLKLSGIQKWLKEFSNFLFLTLEIYFLQKEEISLLDFIMIQSLNGYIINSLDMLTSLLPKEKYLKNILKKSNDFLSWEEEIDNKKNLFQLDTITFSNVSFSYDQYQYILKNLSFKISPAEHILLLGKSGCGKSTICKLLTKVFSPNYGEIKIGKNNLQDLEINSVRSSIIYLNQRSKLITGSIKENILFGRNYNHQKFLEVCEICQIEEIVNKKPLRYETTINYEENHLSGGERQRIMLARTLYTEASVYLLDESLSEVDEKLEKEIIKRIRIFLKEKTLVYISHKNYKMLFDEVIKLEVIHERILIS